MSESAYNSPLPLRRFTDSCCSSPARSIGGHAASDILTDSDGESDFFTEIPGTPDQTVIAGWLKFRDNKKVFNINLFKINSNQA
ncbi:atp-dependent rna helicase [Holotrichia oblita]|uniref:Atp-dependent rna helicase n=1 Tax=Holotrichia oblita TaxID=644536 RepID=A0ACB9SPF9_HOLOL|nr:atp-dependent rna helicase [Holotrichia oblita]